MSTKDRSPAGVQQDNNGYSPRDILEERGTTTVEELKKSLEPEHSVEVDGAVWKSKASEYQINSDADYFLAPECVSYQQSNRYVLRGEAIEGFEAPLRAYRNGRAFVVFAQK